MSSKSRKRQFDSFIDIGGEDEPRLELDSDFASLCDEIGVGKKTQERLHLMRISSFAKLQEHREAISKGSLKDIKEFDQLELYDVCLWHDEQKSHVNWTTDFNEKIFKSFQQENKHRQSKEKAWSPKHLFAIAQHFIHDGDRDAELSKFDSDGELELMYEWLAGETVTTLSEELKQQCFFDVKDYAIQWYRNIFTGRRTQFNIHGQTQSGKSTLKALAFAMCETVSMPLIVITKGVAESKDLKKKIGKLLLGCKHNKSPTGQWWKHDIEMLYVIADTAAQINRAVDRIQKKRRDLPHLQFGVILDEADAMYRTQGREQKTEAAFDALMALGPSLPICITATPLPAWLTHICRQGLDNVTMLSIGTSEDYSGIDNLRPYQDENGVEVFLRHGVLSTKHGVPYKLESKPKLQKRDKEGLFPIDDQIGDIESERPPQLGSRKFIPFTVDKVMKFYDDALLDLHNKKGVLLLDSTCPRVDAEHNIFDKACCIQNQYFVQGKDIVTVVIVGRGIYVRRPGFQNARFTKRTMSEVIQRLDDLYSLDLPIFVFGYSKMRRCISYRSRDRVPTHMVLMLGPGQSNENFIQAIGRATYNGLATLKRNGHDYPKILTAEDDFLMAQKYSRFMHKVHLRSKLGDKPFEALMGVNERFTHEENFMLHSNRKTGMDKTLASLLPGEESFAEPSALDHVNKKSFFWDNSVIQKVLRTFFYLNLESQDVAGKKSFTVNEIFGMYNDTYHVGGKVLKKAELRKILTKLNNDVVICKAGKDSRGEFRWKPKSIKVLEDMLNPEFHEA